MTKPRLINLFSRIITYYKIPKITTKHIIAGNFYRYGFDVYKAESVQTPFCFSCDVHCIDCDPAINCHMLADNKIIFKRTTLNDAVS